MAWQSFDVRNVAADNEESLARQLAAQVTAIADRVLQRPRLGPAQQGGGDPPRVRRQRRVHPRRGVLRPEGLRYLDFRKLSARPVPRARRLRAAGQGPPRLAGLGQVRSDAARLPARGHQDGVQDGRHLQPGADLRLLGGGPEGGQGSRAEGVRDGGEHHRLCDRPRSCPRARAPGRRDHPRRPQGRSRNAATSPSANSGTRETGSPPPRRCATS